MNIRCFSLLGFCLILSACGQKIQTPDEYKYLDCPAKVKQRDGEWLIKLGYVGEEVVSGQLSMFPADTLKPEVIYSPPVDVPFDPSPSTEICLVFAKNKYSHRYVLDRTNLFVKQVGYNPREQQCFRNSSSYKKKRRCAVVDHTEFAKREKKVRSRYQDNVDQIKENHEKEKARQLESRKI